MHPADRPAFVFSPAYEVNIGKHVFPTQKFRLYRDQAISEGLVSADEVEDAPAATDAELLSVLEPAYLDDLKSGIHTPRTCRSELPLTADIFRGSRVCAGGTILAVQRAFERGAAIHFGGGFHHGFRGHAEGFCYVNDAAVGAAVALERGWCRRVALIDTDVHQGNGSARIFQGDDRVFTFSIHQENNYPVKERSDLDIGLEDDCEDAEYLKRLETGVRVAVEEFQPELVIYLGGVDTFIEDKLGGLRLTYRGMEERERLVLEACARRGIPFVTLTAGGYSRQLEDTIALHTQTCRVALQVYSEFASRFARRG